MIFCLLSLTVTAWATPAVCDDPRADHLLRELRRESRCDTYSPPSTTELKVAEELFRRVLAGESLERCSALAVRLKLELRSVKHGGETLTVIAERRDGAVRGWGSFAFRPPLSGPEVLLQAPHSRADRWTGAITQRMFLEGPVRAVAFNGAGRHAPTRESRDDDAGRHQTDDSRGEIGAADVSHSEANLFQALTRAFATACPGGLVVQVHGFSQEKRRSASGRKAEVIVSDGSGGAAEWIRSFERRLEDLLDVDVALYPVEVKELGGTTNRQGALLRAVEGPRFLHLELSLSLRQRLLRESELPGRLARCLLE